MSGRKTFSIIDSVVGAIQAYQVRKRKEQEAAVTKEQNIQKRIAELRAKSSSNQLVVDVVKPESLKVSVVKDFTDPSSKQSSPLKVIALKSRLSRIKLEYQFLVEQNLLENSLVQQSLQKVEKAIEIGDLQEAEAYLQELDNLRIQSIKQLQQQQHLQVQFLQERLDNLRDRLPTSLWQSLQINIEHLHHVPTDTALLSIHQQISDAEMQVEQTKTASENLVNAWVEVGYIAEVTSIDNGDIVIQVETHEGANTNIRVQFNALQVDLFGPPEESSCAARTVEAMKKFQEQGYQLEWTHLDGLPVAEEWRNLYVPTTEDVHEDTSNVIEESIAKHELHSQKISQRSLEIRGY